LNYTSIQSSAGLPTWTASEAKAWTVTYTSLRSRMELKIKIGYAYRNAKRQK
jgi:hypothetical protein